MVEEDSILEGVYILFDAVNHIWIRSGKESPTTIANRFYIGHKKEARTSSKDLYGKYLTEDNQNIREGFRQGYFKSLLLCFAFAFERENVTHLVDTSADRIFEWDVTTMNAINKWNVTGTTKEKQLVLVSYLFELVYELMIAPGYNMSISDGFKSCHGYVTE